MSVQIEIPQIVRVSYSSANEENKVQEDRIGEYLGEIFNGVFHKFEETDSDIFQNDFILMAPEDLSTLECFIIRIVTEKFPGVDIKVTPYILQNNNFFS